MKYQNIFSGTIVEKTGTRMQMDEAGRPYKAVVYLRSPVVCEFSGNKPDEIKTEFSKPVEVFEKTYKPVIEL